MNVKQKEVFEEIVSDDESSVEGEIDYEKELIVIIDYLEKKTKKRKETAKLLKQTERQVVELKEQLENVENLLNKKDECLLDKVKKVEYLKSLDTSMDYAKQLKILEDQVIQLKTSLEEMKIIIEEKDIAYGKSASQIQELKNQIVFLREEVDRVHEILDEGPSASSTVKEYLNCAKMQES